MCVRNQRRAHVAKWECRMQKTYLWAIRASIPRHITHDLCKVFCVLDDKDMPEHLEVIEIRSNVGYLGRRKTIRKKRPSPKGQFSHLERRNERMVGIQVRNYLKTAVEGDDLALDMFLKYPTRHDDVHNVSKKRMHTRQCRRCRKRGTKKKQIRTPTTVSRPPDKTPRGPLCSCCP